MVHPCSFGPTATSCTQMASDVPWAGSEMNNNRNLNPQAYDLIRDEMQSAEHSGGQDRLPNSIRESHREGGAHGVWHDFS